MKKSIAVKWVAALRSGKYKQVQHKLRNVLRNGDVEGFCCLGVLCDISELGGWSGPYGNNYVIQSNGDCGPTLAQGTLSQPIIKWAKIQRHSPRLLEKERVVSLIKLNDLGINGTGPLTFDEIADIIQINYKEL